MTHKITTNPSIHSRSMNTIVSRNGNNSLLLLRLLLMLLLHSFKTQKTKNERTSMCVRACRHAWRQKLCSSSLVPILQEHLHSELKLYFYRAHFLEVINHNFCIPNLFWTKHITAVNRNKSTTQSIGIHSASVFVACFLHSQIQSEFPDN